MRWSRKMPPRADNSFLAGRRVLVTGAASGIGLAIAQRLAGCGAEAILADVAADRLTEAVDQIPLSRAVVADLSRRDDVLRLAEEAGPIDILVNNAGFQHISPVESFDPDRWDQMLAVMLTAPFLLIGKLIPGMYERGWGRIINIASVHGLVASPYKSAYVAAKHGLLGLTRTVALEAAAQAPQVTAHAIAPSYVRTPLVEQQVSEQARVHGIAESEVIERILLDRNATKQLIEPDEVAAAVQFLCRDEAWSMTGAVLTMDAGRLAY